MNQRFSRRAALGGALGALGIATHPGAVWAALAATPPPPDSRPDPRLDRVADLVIPPTATPGAASAGVGAFVRLALRHADGISARGDEWRTLAQSLRRAGFDQAASDQQHRILAAIDREAFAAGPPSARPPSPPWRVVKGLIIIGYYTSEIGGAEELRYELVPGRFDPDIPVGPGFRELSNDWIAVNFR